MVGRLSAQQPISNPPINPAVAGDPRFISVQHLPRLSKVLGDGKAGSSAPGGLGAALQGLADSFGDPRFLVRTYIQPHCQRADPAEVPDDGGGAAAVDRQPLFSAVDDFLGGEQEQRQLFVLGDAGMGKTSLLVMLKLMQLTALWPKHDRCELLKIGDDTLAQIEKIKAPRKTVLLLDALEEDSASATKFHERVAELLRATAGFRRVIITCRTAYSQPDGRRDRFNELGRLAGAGYGRPTIYLSRFNDPQVDKYLKRRFRRMEEPARKRAKIVLSGMGALGSCPLVLSVFDDFVHSRSKVWSEFSIYETMVNAWLDREQSKSVGRKGGALDREVLLDVCVRIARLMALGKSRDSLSAAELAAAQMPATELQQLAGLDCRGAAFLLRDSAGCYRFSHPSIREFLIASGLGRGILHAGKKRVAATSLMITFFLEGDGSAIEWRALDLSEASLAGAHFTGADFSRSLLASADLGDAVFAKTSFDNADLKFCEARGAKFIDCGFKATSAAHASAASIVVERCQLTQASFVGTVLAGAGFQGCTIENTSFADADLSGAVFTRCTLAQCNFTAAQLSGASFRDCTLDGLKFDRCSLAGATFANSTPADVSLLSTDLRGADLDESFLGAVASGSVKNWQDAAWDSEDAKRLRFSKDRNAQNAAGIDCDVTR